MKARKETEVITRLTRKRDFILESSIGDKEGVLQS